MNWTDLCCGITLPIIVIIATIILLFLRKKKIHIKLRNLRYNDDAVIVISRLFAIGIPLILVTIFHICNTMGVGVWEPLLSTSIGLAIILTGAVIAVLGLKTGFYFPIVLIVVMWVLCFYFYIQFETNII